MHRRELELVQLVAVDRGTASAWTVAEGWIATAVDRRTASTWTVAEGWIATAVDRGTPPLAGGCLWLHRRELELLRLRASLGRVLVQRRQEELLQLMALGTLLAYPPPS